jgi:hypothetical protein
MDYDTGCRGPHWAFSGIQIHDHMEPVYNLRRAMLQESSREMLASIWCQGTWTSAGVLKLTNVEVDGRARQKEGDRRLRQTTEGARRGTQMRANTCTVVLTTTDIEPGLFHFYDPFAQNDNKVHYGAL